MRNQQYITITHYKEREFYFLNHAVQAHDGFISKEMEQFHESEKEKFIERIRLLQSQFSNTQIVSISLDANQVVTEQEDKNKASAKIFGNNYVVQNNIDIGNVPTTLYFSPFAILYEEYKKKLDSKLTLLIGLFDRKLYIMFATEDKIHQSWVIGTRGLTEKQVADRVYKSMKAYYKISYKFADHIEMLVTDDSPKLLKVLREELSLNILLTQSSIHNLLHYMAGEQRRSTSSYIKSSLSQPRNSGDNAFENPAVAQENLQTEPPMPEGKVNPLNIPKATENLSAMQDNALNSLDDIRLNNQSSSFSFLKKIKSFFGNKLNKNSNVLNGFVSLLPLLFVLGTGVYFSKSNNEIVHNLTLQEAQSYAQTNNALLAMTFMDVFSAMGKSAELTNAIISNSRVELKGVVWGIEPLRNSLNNLYDDGEFVIKPLENFMTEFSFKVKV